MARSSYEDDMMTLWLVLLVILALKLFILTAYLYLRRRRAQRLLEAAGWIRYAPTPGGRHQPRVITNGQKPGIYVQRQTYKKTGDRDTAEPCSVRSAPPPYEEAIKLPPAEPAIKLPPAEPADKPPPYTQNANTY